MPDIPKDATAFLSSRLGPNVLTLTGRVGAGVTLLVRCGVVPRPCCFVRRKTCLRSRRVLHLLTIPRCFRPRFLSRTGQVDAFRVDGIPHLAMVTADGEVETAIIGTVPKDVSLVLVTFTSVSAL